MVRFGVAAIAAALLAVMSGAVAAGNAPIEITVGKENAKRTITPGAGKDAGQSFRDCPDCPEMVVLPAGSFLMGASDKEPERKRNELPQHNVTFAKPFAVAKFELTWAEWEACGADTCAPGGAAGCTQRNTPYCSTLYGDEKWGRGKRPLINLDFNNLAQYLRWLQEKTGKEYRLLTEAEWEYAARAGTTTPYITGSTIIKEQARFGEDVWGATGGTADAGSFAPNAFGLYDMHGNVWEWVQDCWHDNYDGAPQDGSSWTAKLTIRSKPYTRCPPNGDKRVVKNGDGDWSNYECEQEQCTARVLRGGAWSSNPKFLRSAYRTKYNPLDRNNYYGFRIARSLD